MSCAKTIQHHTNFWLSFVLLSCFGLSACDVKDDLLPSDSDERASVEAGSTGNMPGQIAVDFTIKDSLDNDFVLSEHLSGGSNPADVIVLYFTMWCPVCLSHSDHLHNVVIPQFRNRGTTVFALVDFVSGSVSAARAAELANGFSGSDFITLADVDQSLMKQLNGSMAIVVVIDSDGTVLMNQTYRNGVDLIDILDQQLP